MIRADLTRTMRSNIISIIRDITDDKLRANEIRLASKVFETTADAIGSSPTPRISWSW